MKNIIAITVALLLSSLVGCAGTGLHKKMDMVPDKVSLAIDARPHDAGRGEDWYIGEVTGGFSWNLK